MADVLAAAVAVDAWKVALVGDEPLQMGSNSHQPVFAPRDELPKSCVGAGYEGMAVVPEGNQVALEVKVAYLEETADDDADPPDGVESRRLRDTCNSSCGRHRHLSYV